LSLSKQAWCPLLGLKEEEEEKDDADDETITDSSFVKTPDLNHGPSGRSQCKNKIHIEDICTNIYKCEQIGRKLYTYKDKKFFSSPLLRVS
jgi:hypothetical protein